MALTFNHQTNEISNNGVITVGGVAVGGDNSPKWYGSRAVMMAGPHTEKCGSWLHAYSLFACVSAV